MFEAPIIDFNPGPDRLNLCRLPILVDPSEHESIRIAVGNLTDDLEKVTGHRPPVWTEIPDGPCADGIILIGSLRGSRYTRDLVGDDSGLPENFEGKWETYFTQIHDSPWSCAKRLFAIIGSDNRGTIFGVYTLSEQIGVSPWYWWADVPILRNEHIYALPNTTCPGEPSVKYRGLFINDEAPALTDWVHEKFGPAYNSEFYKKFFELLLRMKANFFWPAMWSGFPEPGSSFFADDPRNQQVADSYGIVVSTSHHEPMQRSTTEWRRSGEGPWVWSKNKEKITEFFRAGAERSRPYESIFTLGMRGEGDDKIESANPKATLKDVITTQRQIIKNAYGKEDAVPQVMALYKEVQEYYEDGLEIPEDVTLMFADDNFGNIRRFPTEDERARGGGIGLYYHLEYVGTPRSYKWLNTNSCGKIQQQLQSAHANGVRHIVTPATVGDFFNAYATREFGSQNAKEISELLLGHDRLMTLRRHEHIEADTFSVINYREAETIMTRYHSLERRAGSLFDKIATSHKAAFFQLIQHPIKASRIYTDLRITQARNQLYGLQRRNATNLLAQKVLDLFEDDLILTEEYHNNPWSGNKWNHIVKQPHYGFQSDTWHAPSRDMISGLCFVQKRQNSNRINGQMGVAVEGHFGIRPGLINEESDRTRPSRGDLLPGLTLPPLNPYGAQSRYFEVFTRGTSVIGWQAGTNFDWVEISPRSGRLSPEDAGEQRIEVTVRWDGVPRDFENIIHIVIRSQEGSFEQVHLPITNYYVPTGFRGFVESDGCIAITPATVTFNHAQSSDYHIFPYLGRLGEGATGLSANARGDPPWLEYSLFFFSHPQALKITFYFTMVLETSPKRKHCYDIAFDGEVTESTAVLETLNQGDLPTGWRSAVQDGVWQRHHEFTGAYQGSHTLKYRPRTEGLLLEKIVVDLGGVRESYLGPPPSTHVSG